mmetsp:Transcript_83089/g.193020  ORF Transcript_83089/g.193020 Transcript_83089/m.193020 type:complete len:456 (+) Transcript_83089:2-1369(+)
MAPTFHTLVDKITCDLPWLRSALQQTGSMDVICGRLLNICSDVYGEGGKDVSQEIRFHLMRNDFMLDSSRKEGFRMKQIELNTVAASFAAHAGDLTEIHRYVLTKHLQRIDPKLVPSVLAPVLKGALPVSSNAEGLAAAMAEAHHAYVGRWKSSRTRAVLFVAGTSENNELDHRKLEGMLFRRHGIVSLRRSLEQLAAQAGELLVPLEGASDRRAQPKALVVDGYEVSVAYFRSGYWPGHFDPLEPCWEVRKLMEFSEAVKCPSAPAQLAGMKKVQQLLCSPENLRRFLEPAQAAEVSRTFALMSECTGDTEEARRAVEGAKTSPGDWVLKPQTEGSGELFFGSDIPHVLTSRKPEELAEFVLMERVWPPVTPSAVFRAEEGSRAQVVVRASLAELGIYGVFVADGPRLLQNKAIGHLLRSKARDTNQGGVFVGNAVVDAPLLLPPEVFWPAVSA